MASGSFEFHTDESRAALIQWKPEEMTDVLITARSFFHRQDAIRSGIYIRCS